MLFNFQKKDLVLHSLVRTWVTISVGMLERIWSDAENKWAQLSRTCYDIVSKHSLKIYTNLLDSNILGDTTVPLLRCFSFISKLKVADLKTNGQ